MGNEQLMGVLSVTSTMVLFQVPAALILKPSTDPNPSISNIASCLRGIIEKDLGNSYTLVMIRSSHSDCLAPMLSSYDLRETYPVITVDEQKSFAGIGDTKLSFTYLPFDNLAYIVVAEHGETLLKILKQLHIFSFWSPRSKVLLASLSNVNEILLNKIFHSAWRKKLINLLLVIPSKESKKIYVKKQDKGYENIFDPNVFVLHIYTHSPFVFRYCGKAKTDLLDVWRKNNFAYSISSFFPDKVFNGNQCPLKVSTFHFPPFVELLNHSGDSIILNGINGRTVNALGKVLNFSIDVIPVLTDMWGRRLQNGTFTGLQGHILEGIADIGLFILIPSIQRYKLFDPVSSLVRIDYGWAVPKSGLLPVWVSIYLPFPTFIWLLTAAAYLSSNMFLMAMKSVFPHSDCLLIRKPFLYMFSCLLNISVPEFPHITLARIFFLLWVLFSLIMSTAYQGALVSFLTHPKSYSDIDNMEQLLESGTEFGGASSAREWFKDCTDKVGKQIYAKWVETLEVDSILEQIATKQRFALSGGKKYMQYVVKTKYIDTSGKPLIHITKESIMSYDAVFLLQKGSPYLSRISSVFSSFVEAGMASKWEDIFISFASEKKQKYGNKPGQAFITIEHLKVAFYMWFLGLFLSFITFLCEALYFRLCLPQWIPVRDILNGK